MTRFLLPLAVIAAAYVALRVWGRRALEQRKLSLAQLLALPWWQWPLARYAISQWKREANAELWEYCLYDEMPKWPTYITVRGWGRRKGWHFYRLGSARVIVRVAPGFPVGDEDEIITVRNRKANKKDVVNQARGTFDLGPVDFKWHHRFKLRHVVITAKPQLPPPPKWHDRHVREVMLPALGPMIWPHGLGRGGKAITRSRKTDNPHLAISGGTGAGKSTALLWYAANVLHFGGLVVICDIKRHSHVWARELPGVLSFPDVTLDPETAPPAAQQINDALVYVMAEVDRRNHECDPMRGDDPWPEFQPVLLVLDEMNPTMTAMNQWWKTARPTTRSGDQAPGTHALQTFLHQGRAVCMSAVVGFHAARRRGIGGGEGFEDIGNFVMMPPYSKNTWGVVAPHIEHIPARSHHDNPAWGVLIDGMDAIEIQRIKMKTLEAIRFSRAGDHLRASWQDTPAIAGLKALGAGTRDAPANGERRAPLPGLTWTGKQPAQPGELIVEDPGTSGEPDDFDTATLREFSSDEGAGTIPMRYDALRKAQDLPGFPEPAQRGPIKPNGEENKAKRLYLRQAVEDWLENRDDGDPGVYVIEPPGSATVKIGETKDLDQRIDSLSLSTFGRRVVRQWFPCRTKQHAQALETWLHAKYRRQQEGESEWFRKEGQLAEDYQDADALLAGCDKKLLPEVDRVR